MGKLPGSREAVPYSPAFRGGYGWRRPGFSATETASTIAAGRQPLARRGSRSRPGRVCLARPAP